MSTLIFRALPLVLPVVLMGCSGSTLPDVPTDAGTDALDAADGGASESSTNDAGMGDVTPTDAAIASGCSSICLAKATACGAPLSSATPDCQAICLQSPSMSQLSCIQASPCSALEAAFDDTGTVCGIGLAWDAGGGDCTSICGAKAASCGAPDSAATANCEALCAKSPTPSQLACAESSSCEALAAAFEDAGTVCGIGVASDGGQRDGG